MGFFFLFFRQNRASIGGWVGASSKYASSKASQVQVCNYFFAYLLGGPNYSLVRARDAGHSISPLKKGLVGLKHLLSKYVDFQFLWYLRLQPSSLSLMTSHEVRNEGCSARGSFWSQFYSLPKWSEVEVRTPQVTVFITVFDYLSRGPIWRLFRERCALNKDYLSECNDAGFLIPQVTVVITFFAYLSRGPKWRLFRERYNTSAS